MPQLAAPPKADRDTEALAAIEEMISEYGLAGMVQVVLRSTLADSLNQTGSGDAALRVIQVLIREIVYDRNPMLRSEIIALGSGIILADKTGVRALARKHGLTPAAISKQVIKFNERFGLQPSQYMRSVKDRETYRLTNRPRTKS